MSLRRRIAANSQSLQKTFPEIYRDLFSRCSIVCSAPGNFYWSGEYAVRYGGIAVKQNLPLRTYVGLEAGTAPGLTIELARHWVPSQRAFSQYAASALPALERISRIITEHFEREGTHLPALKASVVMEVPPGCGLAASASFATALSSALHLYLGKTTPSELARWARQTAVQLTADQAFNNVFHLAWEIEDCIHGATPLTSSGVGPFSSFIGSIYPIVYVRHYRTDADTGGTLHYWAIRMDELYNLKQRPSWPIDFGLIYSGDAGETSASLAAIESFKDDIEERLRAVRGELANYPALQPLLDASFFAEKSKQEIWQRLIEAPKLASIMVLGAFKQLFKSGLTEDGAQKLFKALNMAQGSLSFASVSSPVIDYLCLTLTRAFAEDTPPASTAAPANFTASAYSSTPSTSSGRMGSALSASVRTYSGVVRPMPAWRRSVRVSSSGRNSSLRSSLPWCSRARR